MYHLADLPTDLLRVFARTFELQGVTQAALALHRSQPAISKALKQLEEILATKLFAKSGRGIVPTLAARQLHPLIVEHLAASDQLRRRVDMVLARGLVSLRIGTIESVAMTVLAKSLVTLQRAYPGVELQVRTARTSRLLQWLKIGALDMAVVAYSGPPPGFDARPLRPYALRYAGLKRVFPTLSSVRHPEALAKYPQVELLAAERDAEPVQNGAKVSSFASVKALVLGGFGVGELVDYALTREEARALAFAHIAHDPACHLYFVEGGSLGQRSDELYRLFAAGFGS